RHTRFSRDWSSDVCSSDLMLTSRRWRRMQQQATNEVIARVNQSPGLASSLLFLAFATPILAYLQLILGAQLRHIEPTASHAVFQIGRASCRAGVEARGGR